MTLRSQSKNEYSTRAFNAEESEIRTGCMQRIADATELMAKNHQQLITDRDYYKRRYQEQSEYSNRLFRKVSALRGVVTRQKKRIDFLTRQAIISMQNEVEAKKKKGQP